MKRLPVYIAVVALAAIAFAPLFAQNDIFLGTWKLNLAKSKYTNPPVPKELTRTLEAAGDSIKYTYAGTAADGSAISYGFTDKFDGKDYPVTGSMPGDADMIAIKRVNTHTGCHPEEGRQSAEHRESGDFQGTAKLPLPQLRARMPAANQ